MGHCAEYWKLARRNAGLFQLVHKEGWPDTASLGRDADECIKLLHSRYVAAIRELDEHTIRCPKCQGRTGGEATGKQIRLGQSSAVKG